MPERLLMRTLFAAAVSLVLASLALGPEYTDHRAPPDLPAVIEA